MSSVPLAAHKERLRIHAIAEHEPGNGNPIDEAVDHCRSVWYSAFEQVRDEGNSIAVAKRAAAIAYKLALPLLSSPVSIKAHIACVAQGVNLEVYSGRDAGQLLYAAQVALALYKQEKN